MSKTKALQVLILAPTREIAIQICNVIKSISGFCNNPPVKAYSFIGGQSIKEDKSNLKSCQIAIGTPGCFFYKIFYFYHYYYYSYFLIF